MPSDQKTVEVDVLSDNKKLEEYDTKSIKDSRGTTIIESFIQSKTDTQFSISIKNQWPNNETSTTRINSRNRHNNKVSNNIDRTTSVYLDGILVTSYCFRYNIHNKTYTIDGVNFKSDDNQITCKDEQIIKNLGIIQLDFYNCKIGNQSKKKTDRIDLIPSLSADQKFSECSKKATVSQSTGFGEAYAKPSNNRTWELESKDQYPYLRMILKYRSKEFLQAIGQIEITPEPPIEIEEDDEEEVEEEEEKGKNRSKEKKDIEENSTNDNNQEEQIQKEQKQKITIIKDEKETKLKIRNENEKQIKGKQKEGDEEKDEDEDDEDNQKLKKEIQTVSKKKNKRKIEYIDISDEGEIEIDENKQVKITIDQRINKSYEGIDEDELNFERKAIKIEDLNKKIKNEIIDLTN